MQKTPLFYCPLIDKLTIFLKQKEREGKKKKIYIYIINLIQLNTFLTIVDLLFSLHND